MTDATAPPFFIPFEDDPTKQEEGYAQLAKACGCPVPGGAERLYSITFVHDGIEWTATVGEKLQPRGKTPANAADDSIVLAIFPGDPYMVFTTAGLSTSPGYFANPFMAGLPKSETLFAVPEGTG